MRADMRARGGGARQLPSHEPRVPGRPHGAKCAVKRTSVVVVPAHRGRHDSPAVRPSDVLVVRPLVVIYALRAAARGL